MECDSEADLATGAALAAAAETTAAPPEVNSLMSEVLQVDGAGVVGAQSMESMVCIRASEAFPLRPLAQTEEAVGLTLPFALLSGESATFLGRHTEGVIALSTYRLFIQLRHNNFFNVPLGLLESVESRDIIHLYAYCKDARTIRCTFSSNELCVEWCKRVTAAIAPPVKLDDVFAFPYFAWHSEHNARDVTQQAAFTTESLGTSFEAEVERMGFDLKNAWRIAYINSDYSLCGSYPREILVPASVENDDLTKVAGFRSSRRIPAVVWRHQTNGAVIARCSQPEVGWLGWRNNVDENLLHAILQACIIDGENMLATATSEDVVTSTAGGGGGAATAGSEKSSPPKLLIIDARSYAAAVANRAKGGGCECPEYYPNCEIQFMSLANIHSIRRSFQSVRLLCGANSEQTNWYSVLENSKWLQHMGGLLKSALMVVNAVDRERRPVLVHCSDGWDRTPQIVALAQLMLDPYYRTMHGFQVLVEREWLEFGHKFGDRCGHGQASDDTNERCPVFLQWLDCVHQLLNQFPCNFEFNSHFLVKLTQHTYSCLFGTFLCNSSAERGAQSVRQRTYSVWAFLQNHESAARFRNYLYVKKDQVLRPSCHVRDLQLWSAVYLQGSDTSEEAVMTAPAHISASSSGLSTPQGEHAPISHSPLLLSTLATDDPATRPLPPSHATATISASGCSSSSSAAPCSLGKTRSCADLSELAISELSVPRQRRSSADCGIQQRLLDDASEQQKSEDDASEDDDVVVAADVPTTAATEDGEVETTLSNGHCELPDEDSVSSADETLAERVAVFLTNGNVRAPPDSDNDDEDTDEPTLAVAGWPAHPNSAATIESSTDTLVGELHAGCDLSNLPLAPQPSQATPAPATNGCEGEHGCCDASSLSRCREDSQSESLAQHVSTSTSDLNRCVITTRHPWSSCPAHGVDHHQRVNGSAAALTNGLRWDGGGSLGAERACVLCLNGSNHDRRGRCMMDANLDNLEMLKQLVRARPTPSRTPSSGFPATPSSTDERLSDNSGAAHRSAVGAPGGAAVGAGSAAVVRRLDVDGLSMSPDESQQRLHELVTEHQATRYTLQQTWCMLQLTVSHQKMCQRCCGNSRGALDPPDEVGSLAGSASSGEQQSSLGPESTSASDVSSWEQVDERETRPTLWVPDHAVSRCAGCSVEFCIVRRKHHCRNCGDIFCSDCSSQMLPIPNEHLYHPVRVCCTCFERLRANMSPAQQQQQQQQQHQQQQQQHASQPSAAFNDMRLPKAILAGTPSSN